MKSYIFRVDLSQDEDGRWNAVVPSLPACYTWGNTKEEALIHIQDAVRCCVEDLLAHGEPLPPDVEVVDAPVAAVTL
ncbi:MAG: type II toxin-antitoxin system HicB family antitoxin [Chloroflexota bacterium]|nr:MAG: type II toxin-antitoxin system HicB family antitoxin [Chloroflexota bacterium]